MYPKLRYMLGLAYWFLFASVKPAFAFQYGASVIKRVPLGKLSMLKASVMAALVAFMFLRKKKASHKPFVYGSWRTDIPKQEG